MLVERGNPILHLSPNSIGVGKPMDKDAEHGVRCVVCGVLGGIFATGCPTEGTRHLGQRF